MMYPKISLLVLTWNEKDILIKCLKSIQSIDYDNFEVIVIDNGSKDGTAAIVEDMFPYMQLIKIKDNVGAAEGVNFGIKYALSNKPDYIFFTANDTIMDKNIFKELIKIAEGDKSIGIVGPTEYSMENPEEIRSAGGFINWRCGTLHHKRYINNIEDVDYLGFILMKVKMLKEIGIYNSVYFTYWEDTDLCTRAKKAGYRVLCVENAKIWHKGSHTTKKKSGFVEYQLARNNFWFMKIHAFRRNYFIFLIYYFIFRIWLLSFIYIFKYKNIHMLSSYLKGVYDGFLLNPNETEPPIV